MVSDIAFWFFWCMDSFCVLQIRPCSNAVLCSQPFDWCACTNIALSHSEQKKKITQSPERGIVFTVILFILWYIMLMYFHFIYEVCDVYHIHRWLRGWHRIGHVLRNSRHYRRRSTRPQRRNNHRTLIQVPSGTFFFDVYSLNLIGTHHFF